MAYENGSNIFASCNNSWNIRNTFFFIKNYYFKYLFNFSSTAFQSTLLKKASIYFALSGP